MLDTLYTSEKSISSADDPTMGELTELLLEQAEILVGAPITNIIGAGKLLQLMTLLYKTHFKMKRQTPKKNQ